MDNQTLVLLVLKVTALVSSGAVVALSLHRASAGARYLVWLTTLLGLVLLPAVLRFAPLRLEVLPRSLAVGEEPLGLEPQAAAMAKAEALAPRRDEAVPSVTGSQSLPEERAFRLPPITLRQGLLGAWAVMALVLLGRLATGVLAVRRILRGAQPLEDRTWTALLAEAADRLGLADLPKLVASDRVQVPFAFGVWRPTIVLPDEATRWSDERRRLVLSHELAHLGRHDLLGHTMSRIACAMYWFHPLVWVAARRLRAESERACDDLVLESGARPSDYADHLLDILASVRGQEVPTAALAMGRRREFEGRLLAILDPGLKRGGPRAQRAVLLGGLAALFATVAASAPSAPPPRLVKSSRPAPERVAATESSLSPQPAGLVASTHPERNHTRASPPTEPASNGEDNPSALTSDRRATLVRVLRSDSEASVRRTAAWALAGSQEGDVADALAAALRGDGSAEVREMAAWALHESGSAKSAAALAEALRGDSSRDVRATAAWTLGQSRPSDTSALVAGVSDSAPKVREVAIWALGNQRPDKAPAALGTALRDPEERVRVVAAWALAQIHDPTAAATLQDALKAEKDDEVRQALFHALFLVGERSPEVAEWAFGSKDPELRKVAVKALAGRGFGPWPWPWPRPEPRPFP